MRAAPARVTRWALLVAVIGVVTIAAGTWLVSNDHSAQADTAAATMPRSSSIEDRYGIRVLGAYLTAADGMIQIQYQVLDQDKAQDMGEDAAPVLVADGDTFDVDGLAGHGHTHRVPVAGRDGFVLLANIEGKLHEGDEVSVRVGKLVLDGVVLE